MELGPILRALLRNKTNALLIALQCALTFAILINAAYIIEDRMSKMDRPSGIDVDNLFFVSSIGFTQNFNPQTSIAEDLQTLRALPGIKDVTTMNAVPLSGGGASSRFRAQLAEVEDEHGAVYYQVDNRGLNTLGLKLIAGRDFSADDMKQLPERTSDYPRSVIITQSLANKLFPDGSALGKLIYSGKDTAQTVVGIVERLQAPWINSPILEESLLMPLITLDRRILYMVRAEPGKRDQLMPVVEQTLQKINDGRIVRNLMTQADTIKKSYSGDRAMAIILTGVCGLILAITTLGIIGLTTFNVRRRTKQIGTRRALGARQRDILRYFMLENWIVTTAGLVFGTLLTYALNIYLVQTYSLPPLKTFYIPVAVVFMWLIGQIAVFAPARRASQISPAIATRNV